MLPSVSQPNTRCLPFSSPSNEPYFSLVFWGYGRLSAILSPMLVCAGFGFSQGIKNIWSCTPTLRIIRSAQKPAKRLGFYHLILQHGSRQCPRPLPQGQVCVGLKGSPYSLP